MMWRHWTRHTAVSIMSGNGVPIQDTSDTVAHKSTHIAETMYQHVIVPQFGRARASWTACLVIVMQATQTGTATRPGTRSH